MAHGAAALGVAELYAHPYFAEDVFEMGDQVANDVHCASNVSKWAARRKERDGPGAFWILSTGTASK